MVEWKFRRRQGWCGRCEHRFEEGERYVSAISVREDEILREDSCARCFAARSTDEDLFWWFTRHAGDGKRRLKLDLEALERLFHGLEGRTGHAPRELRFVLSLLLMRKRRLKLERVVRDAGGEAMIVRRPRSKDSVRVDVFDFGPERLEELKRELQEVFEGAEPAESTPGSDAEEDPRSELLETGAS